MNSKSWIDGNFPRRLFSLVFVMSSLLTVGPARALDNTPFVITNNLGGDPTQIWISFQGVFGDSGEAQYLGGNTITDFTSAWTSVSLDSLATDVTASAYGLSYFTPTPTQYAFSLNDFIGGRIYVTSGSTAPLSPPAITTPQLIFEPTINGAINNSNIDLSYVNAVSTPGGYAFRNATDGTYQSSSQYFSPTLNPITTDATIVANAAALVPTAAHIMSGETVIGIQSSQTAPTAYHDWNNLMTALGTNGPGGTPLNVGSFTVNTSPTLVPYGLNGVYFGDSDQGYVSAATFSNNISQDADTATLAYLTSNGYAGQAGVVISGSGVMIPGGDTPAGTFNIYILESTLNAVTGIYGNNPAFILESGGVLSITTGLTNDLYGRVAGDLVAGMVFGWSKSDLVSIATHAVDTGLIGVSDLGLSSDTLSDLSTGEYFALASLAAAQGKLGDWIGGGINTESDYYDQYLYALSSFTGGYTSAFEDRLAGLFGTDSFWYTSNPPANPYTNGATNYDTIGFVNLTVGAVPEPSSALLIFCGAAALGVFRRSRVARPPSAA